MNKRKKKCESNSENTEKIPDLHNETNIFFAKKNYSKMENAFCSVE